MCSSSSGSSEHSYSSGPSVSLAECQTTFSGPTTKLQTTNTTNKICSSNATQMWGTAAGSDGDSMPESPLSLDDGKLNSLNSYFNHCPWHLLMLLL